MTKSMRDIMNIVEAGHRRHDFDPIDRGQMRDILSRGVILDRLAGDYIDCGHARIVFIHRNKPGLVVKVELAGAQNNDTEWEAWQIAKDHPVLRDWFAPCRERLADGRVLIMERTGEISKADLPAEYPRLFWGRDLIPTESDEEGGGNWGMLDGRPVCHDYGHLDYDHRRTLREKIMDPAMAEMIKYTDDYDEFNLGEPG